MSLFETLNAINVNEHTEKKNNLTYLSWAWAWAELKKRCPDATYTIYENKDGLNYHHDGKTAWVKTGVTAEGIEMVEMLPVMDFKNKSIPVDQITSFDVNKTIQRSLTKAVARHGLGLYIYAGEDLPEGDAPDDAMEVPKTVKKPPVSNVTVTSIDPPNTFNVNTAIDGWCKYMNCKKADFARLRGEAIQRGLAQDIPSKDMTPVDFDSLCKAIEKMVGL